MRNPRRDKLEYMLYATVMTGTVVAMGLLMAFGVDENGQRRKPVMDQPFEESLREANIELKEFGARKYDEGEQWADSKGYGDLYRKLMGGNSGSTTTTSSTASSSSTPQQTPTSFLDSNDRKYNSTGNKSDNSNNNTPKRWWA